MTVNGMRLALLICAAASVAGWASVARAARASQATPADGVDDYLRAEMEKRHIPGLSLAVVRNGKVVKMRGYGRASVELDVPVTADTVYEIGSVTKQFTATLAMLLAGENRLALDERIGAYLPDLPEAWKSVTVRHLLTHTSGIKSYTGVPDFGKRARSDMTPEEIIGLVAAAPPDFAPGERYAYNNTGYFLLGLILQKAGGKPYGELLRERIFGPLGMTATRVNDLRAILPNRASGYSWEGNQLRNAEYTSMTWPFAAGALVSTVRDLARWEQALAAHTILPRATLERMWTPATLADGTPTGYGFGWVVGERNGRRRISHAGGITGFTCDISRFVDDGITVIVLTNTDAADPSALTAGVAGRYVPALAPAAAKPIEDPDPAMTAMLRGVLRSIIEDKLDPDRFTPEMLAVLSSAGGKQATESLKAFGPLGAFALLARTEENRRISLRYRAVFGTTPVLFTVDIDANGKIAGLLFKPE
jgi:D-alanyl-D-alanine carboxypeptidase